MPKFCLSIAADVLIVLSRFQELLVLFRRSLTFQSRLQYNEQSANVMSY